MIGSVPMWREPDDPDIVRHTKVVCPHCGKWLNAAGAPDAGVSLRKPTADEQEAFHSDPESAAVIRRIRESKKLR